MIFSWLKKRRRRRINATPFSAEWRNLLAKFVPHLETLTEAERGQLESLVQVFVAEKNWEGCQGLEITDEIRVAIAGQACLLLLGIEHDYFANVDSVLVFPRQFVSMEREEIDEHGIVHTSSRPSLGEAWDDGPVILSWSDSRAGGRNDEDGLNVVIHEFAHKLDLRDGVVNGTPPLKSREEYRRWAKVMRREYDTLIELSNRGRATLIDDYGATNPGEFLAVSVECFFEKPRQMEDRHPELYDVLRGYFGQDPAARLTRHIRAERSD